MEQDIKKMGGGAVENAASGGILFILSSFNVRPGNTIAIVDGKIRYDGPAQDAPPEILKTPGAILLMHEHDKARLTAALNKAQKAGRIPGPIPQVATGRMSKGDALATETMLARTTPFPGEKIVVESNPTEADFHADTARRAHPDARGTFDFSPAVLGNSELDAGAANHFDPNKRFFNPK